jgi:hypothetical protein
LTRLSGNRAVSFPLPWFSHELSDGEKKPGFLRQLCPKSSRFPKNQPSEAGLLALGNIQTAREET